jgi:hypothetical protein
MDGHFLTCGDGSIEDTQPGQQIHQEQDENDKQQKYDKAITHMQQDH